MITLEKLKQTKTYLCATLLLTTLSVNAQEPLATDNVLIEGVTVDSFFQEQVDDTRTNFADHAVDGEVATLWAAQTSDATNPEDAFIIIDLAADYDLAEIQILVPGGRRAPYVYDFLISTTGTGAADFMDPFTAADKGVNGFLESNYDETSDGSSVLDGTYKSFILPAVVAGAKYVKIIAYGRIDLGDGGGTTFTSINELKFYAAEEATASTRDDQLSQALVYPNPVNDVLNLSDLNAKVDKIQVLDLTGKILITKKIEDASNDIAVDTSSLSNGVYFVNFSNTVSGTSGSKTIVVQH